MNDIAHRLMEPGVFSEEAEARRADNWAEAMRIARLHARVFDTDAGKLLLAHWVTTFMARSIVRPHEDAYAQGIREGQANVVRQLLVQLEVARTGPIGE